MILSRQCDIFPPTAKQALTSCNGPVVPGRRQDREAPATGDAGRCVNGAVGTGHRIGKQGSCGHEKKREGRGEDLGQE